MTTNQWINLEERTNQLCNDLQAVGRLKKETDRYKLFSIHNRDHYKAVEAVEQFETQNDEEGITYKRPELYKHFWQRRPRVKVYKQNGV